MKKYIYILLLTCFSLPLLAKDYPVTNIEEFNKVVKMLQPGDAVILSKGTWTNSELVFFGEGTKENPIILKVEEVGKTTLEGQSSLQMYGNYLIVDGLVFVNGCAPGKQVIDFRKGANHTANNSILRNCVIDSYNKADRWDEDTWVGMWGRHNEVTNCYFGGKTNHGVTLIVWPNGEGHNQNYHLISKNYFAARPRLGSNGGETMRIGTSTYSMENSNTIVQGNYFEHCNGETEIVSIKSCENRVINNTFFECEGSLVLRHGNRNEVSGNYFIGNHKANTGGVRIINEGQKVFNNYFYALKGKDFRGPLVIMNGVPNSVINRYHQVKDAEIMFNTWVDCELPWQLCVGSDEERTAIPLSTKIAHNIVYGANEIELVKAFDKTTGFTFENNLLISSKGVQKNEGGVQGSITVSEGANGFPIVSSNVTTKENIASITVDIDGRERGNSKSIGAIEANGGKGTKEIASKNNVGPSWYKPSCEVVNENKVITISPAKDALYQAVKKSKPGNIIELQTGEYTHTKRIVIPHTLTIRAAKNAATRPIVKADAESTLMSIFEIKSGLTLKLNDLEINGEVTGKEAVKYAIMTGKEGFESSYNVYIDNCEFYNFKNSAGGAIYKAYKGSFADSLIVINTIFRDSYRGFALNEEKDGKGFYNAEFMTFDNTVFKNIDQWAFDFLRGGNDESTLGGNLIVNHCVFDNVNNNPNQVAIKHTGLVNIDIANTVFLNCPQLKFPVRLSGRHNTMSYCNIYQSGKVGKTDGAIEGKGIIYVNPQYKKGSYQPEAKSPLVGKASDNSNIGLRP